MFRGRKLKGNYGTVSYKRPRTDIIDKLLGSSGGTADARLDLPPLGLPALDPQARGLSGEEAPAGEDEWYECEEEEEAGEDKDGHTADRSRPFDRIRAAMASFYVAYAPDVQKRVSALCQAEKLALEEAFTDGSCSCSDPACRGPSEKINESPYTACVLTMSCCHLINVPVLRCKTCAQHFYPNPLQLGCLPGTVNAYEMKSAAGSVLWFHLGLLQQLDAFQYHAKMDAMYSTAKSLHDIWDAMQPLDIQTDQVPTTRPSLDQLRKQLADAVRYSSSTGAIHTFQFDCCFKLCLLKWRNYGLDYPAPANRRLFVDNSDVQSFEAAAQGYLQAPTTARSSGMAALQLPPPTQQQQPPPREEDQVEQPKPPDKGEEEEYADLTAALEQGAGACHQFTADKVVARDGSKYLVTAVGLAVCRHGHIYVMVNLSSGEKHIYAIYVLQYLLLIAALRVMFWWYDINCRWLLSWLRWMSKFGSTELRDKAAQIKFPIPPFHLYAHKESCRISHGHLQMEGAGMGTGDVCERVNAAIGPHGAVTQYMDPTNREARLERVSFRYTRELDSNLPNVLASMSIRAYAELAESTREEQQKFGDLCHKLAAAAGSSDTRAHANQLVSAAAAAAGIRPHAPGWGWEAEYVRSRAVIEGVDNMDGTRNPFLPPISLLLRKEQFSKMQLTQQMKKEALRTARQLVAVHFAGKHPEDLGHPSMQLGLNQWVGGVLHQALDELSSLLAQARFADQVVTALSGRRAEQRKALKRKDNLRAQALTGFTYLQQWGQWAASVQAGGHVREWDAEVQRLIAWATTAAAADVLKGNCPLVPLAGSGEEGSLADLSHQVWTLRLRKQRAEEEIQLVAAEQTALQGNLAARVAVLQVAAAAAGTPSLFYARELQHVKAIQARCEQVFGMSHKVLNEAAAAVVLLALGDGDE